MKPYSRLEKDFLGNERMVFYDENGQMTGVSEVMREADGTLRVLGTVPVEAGMNPMTGTTEPAIDPQPSSPRSFDAGSEQLAKGRGQVHKLLDEQSSNQVEKQGFKSSTVALIGVVAFLVAGGLAFAAMSSLNRPLPPPTSGLVTETQTSSNPSPDVPTRSESFRSSPPEETSVPMPADVSPGQGVPDEALNGGSERSRRWIEGGRRTPDPTLTSPTDPKSDQINVEESTDSAKPTKRKKEKEKPKQNPDDPVDLGRDDGAGTTSGSSTNSGDGTSPPPSTDNQSKD
jgi:hypothetical protein